MKESEKIAIRCQEKLEELVKCLNESNLAERYLGKCSALTVGARKCRTELYLKQREEHNKESLANFSKETYSLNNSSKT